MRGLRRALAFLTIWPVSIPERMEPDELGRAAAWFPWIGLVMGGILWGLHTAGTLLFPPMLVGALLVAAWVGLSGGLHLDGFADCCDGLFASASPARRLEIMRDTGVGAFGVVGVVLLLMAKTAAVASLVDGRGLVLAPLLGRWVMLALARGPAARTAGLGEKLRSELPRRRLVPGLILAVVLSGLLGWSGWGAFVLVHLVALAWGRLAQSRLGGQTGDVLGAAGELAEVAALLAFSWMP